MFGKRTNMYTKFHQNLWWWSVDFTVRCVGFPWKVLSFQCMKEFRSYLQINWHKNSYHIETCCMELTGGLKNFITDTFPYRPTSLIGRRPSGVTRYISKRVFLAKMRLRSLGDVKFPAKYENTWSNVYLSWAIEWKKVKIAPEITSLLAAHNRWTLWYSSLRLQILMLLSFLS